MTVTEDFTLGSWCGLGWRGTGVIHANGIPMNKKKKNVGIYVYMERVCEYHLSREGNG